MISTSRNKIVSALLLLTSFILANNHASAWGKDGHQTIGYLAASLIQGTNAEAHVAALLEPGETLATAAEWPDCAKGYTYCQAPLTDEMKQYGADNPKHHSYHYTDVPFQLTEYDPDEMGTTPDDVVHILQDAILILQNKPPIDPAHNLTQREALFVIAHMVGDIHQPLHVGAGYVSAHKFIVPNSDAQAKRTFSEGGNWLCVGSKGLHSLWDTEFVKRAMVNPNGDVDSDEAFADRIKNSGSAPENTGTAILWPGQWATETLALANEALSDVDIVKKRPQGPKGSCSKANPDKPSPGNMWTVELPDGYQEHAENDVVPKQLHKAGVRLANVLMAIWP